MGCCLFNFLMYVEDRELVVEVSLRTISWRSWLAVCFSSSVRSRKVRYRRFGRRSNHDCARRRDAPKNAGRPSIRQVQRWRADISRRLKFARIPYMFLRSFSPRRIMKGDNGEPLVIFFTAESSSVSTSQISMFNLYGSIYSQPKYHASFCNFILFL